MLATRVVRNADDLSAIRADWDRLAVASRQPYGGPGWALSWLANAVPRPTDLRVILVSRQDRLVGVAPLFAHRRFGGMTEYRLFGAGSAHRLGPVCEPGLEAEVARAAGVALGRMEPVPATLRLEAIDASSPWPSAFAAGWAHHGAAGSVRNEFVLTAPAATLGGGSFESWLGSRPKRSRQQFERLRRRHREAGSTIRMVTTPEEAGEALDSLAVLYERRWRDSGGHPFPTWLLSLVRDAAPHMLEGGRLRIWTLRLRDEIVSVQVFVAAGGQVAAWRGAFDPALTALAPGLVTILAAVEDAFERGDTQIDFGGGDQPYKWRFADLDRPVAWFRLFPASPRTLVTKLQLAPEVLAESQRARAMLRKLPPRARNALRRVV